MVPSLQDNVNTSWGGNIIEDADGRFHMFVNAIANHCLLGAWMRNSRIDHVISDTISGPYHYQDTAVPMWSSNPAPLVLPRGAAYKYAIFHIGNGSAKPGPAQHCFVNNGSRVPPSVADGVGNKATASGSPIGRVRTESAADGKARALYSNGISVSNSLGGPWQLLADNTLPPCNNPAPWVHPNGTLYALCDSDIYRAHAVVGPWLKVSSIWNPTSSRQRPKTWHYEDAFLFTTRRGWHALFHAGVRDNSTAAGHDCSHATVSAHMFSLDGFEWHASAISPYGTQVEVLQDEAGAERAGKRAITVATRERPKLRFNSAGEITHLINGVCGAPSCTDSPRTGCMDCKYGSWDFTLIQALDTASD